MNSSILEGINSELVFKNEAKNNPFSFFNSNRKLPTIFIIGVQKGGTTSLLTDLIQHPEIIAPKYKETFYFNDVNNFNKGLNWYKSHFPLNLSNKIKTIDASANYFESIDAAKKIKEVVPDAKIILLLRNPVDRAFSHYKMAVKRGFEKLSFEAALESEQSRIEYGKSMGEHNYAFQKLGYASKGKYSDFLPSWLNQFNKDEILILSSEEYFNTPKKTLEQIVHFLNLNPFSFDTVNWKNKGNSETINETTKSNLEEYFKPYNEELYNLLGKKLTW